MSPASNTDTALLRDRAHLFAEVRSFFAERNVLEVDTPLLGKAAPVDAHIDVMRVALPTGEEAYLHTSPEYAMKRLLSQGLQDIYQMSHVFREGEVGARHNPEFTMIEWYRSHLGFLGLIEETLELISLFLGKKAATHLTYREAFLRHLGLDYLKSSPQELRALIPEKCESWDKDTCLHYLMGFKLEPQFQELTVLTDYPASQSALARVEQRGDEAVAKRFEIYYRGVELANGFYELTDAKEQRRRFEEANSERLRLGKKTLPIDERFLEALGRGLPDCCGVAVGFDRLMMLRSGKKTLTEVMPFAWDAL